MNEPYHLQRFLDPQARVIETVYSELKRGNKRSHWMWFIFPQIEGLGHSDMARKYAISCLEEACAYLDHPVLGPRLRACTRLVTMVEGRSITQILGYPDDLKFQSSMTLFARATPDNAVFLDSLKKYFEGKGDQATIDRLQDSISA